MSYRHSKLLLDERYYQMNINIIYESQFGNGKKIVEGLAAILEEKDQKVELFPVGKMGPDELPAADLYIFSTPTLKFMLPRNIGNFIKRFTPPSKNTRYALMTTYLDPRTIALKKMDALLKKKAMIKAADDFKTRVLGMKGPLKEGYEENLKKFADDLLI